MASATATSGLPPLSLYVHFPWCVRKCPYCDFNSHALRGELPEARYVEALLQDLAAQAPAGQGRAVQSIFLGGGTPSLFSAQAIARLLEGCRRELTIDTNAEITLEANPGTVERGRFADYRAAGITRVSLGAQSFSDQQLRRLGRIHSASHTRQAAEELHAAGLVNFNLDLMYGLPGQRVADALADVEAALALVPAHLSHYQLTLEPGTLFGARPPTLPDEDEVAGMLEACMARLAAEGFARYEVSAYARSGARCRHNLNYWQFGDYLGIGAGAHGKCTRWQEAALQVERTTRAREPRRYVQTVVSGALERRVVPASDLPFEYLMNALRLIDGFATGDYERHTSLPFASLQGRFDRLHGLGLLESVAGRWRASARGLDLLNEVLSEFLPMPPAEQLHCAPASALQRETLAWRAPPL
jgi:oxygen-independent coproporphyrinogen-3 oxidase